MQPDIKMADAANAFAAETPNMQRNNGAGKRKRGADSDANAPATRRAARFQPQAQPDAGTDPNLYSLGGDMDLSALQGGHDNANAHANSSTAPHAHDASPAQPGEPIPTPYHHMNVPGQDSFQGVSSGTNNGHAEFHDEGATAAAAVNSTPDPNRSRGDKPQVGSDEWHKVRKDNHKEVERRRRETINEGINELAKIVPGCEKNKGSILGRAVQYIQRLQDDASTNIDKWTFEKLITEQAISEISAKCHKAYAERDAWRRIAAEAGADVDHVDLGIDEVALQKEIDAGHFAAAEKDAKRSLAEREKALQEARHAPVDMGNAGEPQT